MANGFSRITLMGATLSALACSTELEPCHGLELGDRLQVTVVTRAWGANPSAPAECDAELDLEPGRELSMVVRAIALGEDHQSCLPADVEVEPFGDWRWDRTPARRIPGQIGGVYSAMRADGCSGTLETHIFAGSVPTEPSDMPDATLQVSFSSDDDSVCSLRCGPVYRVAVARE